jgi:DNA replication protein DnaC
MVTLKKRRLVKEDYEIMEMPLSFRDVTWKEFEPIQSEIKIVPYLQRVCSAMEDGDGLFVTGSPSSGKSRIAAMVAKLVRQYGYTVHWTGSLGLQESMNTYKTYDDGDSEYPMVRRYEQVDCLVVDDLGGEKTAVKFDRNYVIEVIEKRMTWNKATLVTTNIGIDDLMNRYGESFARKMLSLSFPVAMPFRETDFNPAVSKYGDK